VGLIHFITASLLPIGSFGIVLSMVVKSDSCPFCLDLALPKQLREGAVQKERKRSRLLGNELKSPPFR